MAELVRRIEKACDAKGLKPVSRKAVQARIDRLDQHMVAVRRGELLKAEDLTLRPGSYDVCAPMERWQIDHTPVDVLLVSAIDGEVLGRPYLTLIIDVASRMVAGYFISWDQPGARSVAMALLCAVQAKGPLLERLGLTGDWPICGLPVALHSDNAAEFAKSVAYRRACDNSDIERQLRDIGKPRDGAHIERLIGSMMARCHFLPGTTFSNIRHREKYDSAGNATLTIEELEKWLVEQILDYHERRHGGLGCSPRQAWEASLPLRRRLVALYNADRRREARKLFERLPVAVRSQPAYAELGFAIYERSGLLAKAKASLEIALAVEPFDLELRLKWINAAERSGRGGEVADWLKQVPPTLEGRPEQLMTLAGTMDRLGVHGGVLPLAYRALRAGYSNPRIHTSYTLGLFIIGRAGKAERTTPEVAGPDVAVTLEEVAGDRTLVYVLETAPDPRIERQEIAWDGDLAKQLTGVRIGDRIELSNLGRDASYFTVTGLMDKYLHAHFRSLNDFRSLFPSDKTLGQFTFDPDAPMESLRPLLDDVRDRRTRGETLQQHYMSGALPVAVLGQLTGTSAFDVWEGIRASRDLIFMTAVGTVEESVGGVERAAAAKSAVVDPVTLYGLARLGIVGNVIAGFDEVGLVQGTLDLLRTHYEDCVEAARNGGGSLQAVGEGFALLESTEADQKARIDEAAEILAFAETLPIYPSEAIQPIAEAAQAIFMSLPPAYVDTVFAAQVPGRVLLCDDRAMRLLAETAGLITAVWSQAAVAASAQAGRLTTPQIIQATLAFIHAKSVFTMVPAWLVGAIIDQADWSVTNADVGTIIDHTTGAGNDPESLYNLWSVVLVYGWFNADRSTLRETAGAVIRGLSLPAGRPTPQGVVSALCSRIGTRLETLIPVSRTALLSTTRLTRLEVLRRPGREAAQVVIGEIFQFLTSVRLELERIQRSGEDSLE